MKNPLARGSPLPCLSSVHTSSPLKSSLSTHQNGLPDIVPTAVLQNHRSKKRVRFALQLKPVEEDSLLSSDHENLVPSIIKPNIRSIDPWREDGPLYGAYVEYLRGKDVFTPDTSDINRPLRPMPSEPEVESSTFTHTFVIRNRSPEDILDSIMVRTPSPYLPRIVHRISPTKKIDRKHSLSVVDSCIKQRINAATPPRHNQSKKISNSVNNKNQLTSIHPTTRRVDLALPLIRNSNSTEKLIRPDYPLGARIGNEYLQSKKLTEMLTNPLPGTNNQISYISGHSMLPNLSKTPQMSCHNQMNNEPYFFQNYNNDHFQPIIHSTH